MGSIISHLHDIINEYGSWENYLQGGRVEEELVCCGELKNLPRINDPNNLFSQRYLPSACNKNSNKEIMATHYLKCLPEFFERSQAGVKNYEIRINDRNYQVGDTLILQLYDLDSDTLLGPRIERKIDYILKGGKYGIAQDYVILELVPLP